MADWANASRLASRYRHLASLITTHGARYPKRHGNWIKLEVTPLVCLTMDSWNRAIHLRCEPAPFVNEVLGFSDGGSDVYLGIDFGGLEVKISEARLEAIIRATESVVGKAA